MVSVEAYPQLQSNQNFLNLQRELSDTEDRIAAGRRFYNANVGDYNTRIEAFPSNLIAGMFKFDKAGYFEVEDQQVRSVPQVSFGSIGAVPGDQDPPAVNPGPGSSGGIQPEMPGAGQPSAGLPPADGPAAGGGSSGGPPAGAPGPQDGRPPFTGGR
jgi:LemA protein